MSEPVPAAAITAAYAVLADALSGGHYAQAAGRELTRKALEAAAPVTAAQAAAAERERIRKLAVDVDAWFMDAQPQPPSFGVVEVERPFAELLDGDIAIHAEPNVDWQAAQALSDWLDNEVSQPFKDQPLAQDWARISKVAEETGEAIEAFIGATGQNPRKGKTHSMDDLAAELSDVALTGIYALVHFFGWEYARDAMTARQRRHHDRIGLPFADLLEGHAGA